MDIRIFRHGRYSGNVMPGCYDNILFLDLRRVLFKKCIEPQGIWSIFGSIKNCDG